MNELPLRDIHLPDPVSWWPLATGWWLLLALFFVCLIGLFIYNKITKHKTPVIAYRKLAISELDTLKQQSQQQSNLESLRAISNLLRRISLSYYPRKEVASLSGEKWTEKLNALSNDSPFTAQQCELLSNASYQQNVDYDRDALFNLCEKWIKQLPATSQYSVNT